MITPDRTLVSAVVVHILAVVAFLIAVAAGGDTRLLLALFGGVGASIAWITWLRSSGRSAWETVPAPRAPHELPARIH